MITDIFLVSEISFTTILVYDIVALFITLLAIRFINISSEKPNVNQDKLYSGVFLIGFILLFAFYFAFNFNQAFTTMISMLLLFAICIKHKTRYSLLLKRFL